MTDCPQCEYHKNRAARWRAEAYRQAGHDVIELPWVGLTDEEIRDLDKQFNAERVRTSDEEYLIIYPGDYWAWQRAVEAKLREKNA